MEEEQLDYVLVPLGLLVFGLYNVWLLFTVLRFPRRTVIGINAETRHQWVFSMMSVKSLFSLSLSLSLSLSVCTLQALTSYVYIYIYVCVCVCLNSHHVKHLYYGNIIVVCGFAFKGL